MADSSIDVFFYGLFMDPDGLRAMGLNPTSPRKATAPGLALQIGDRATLVRRNDGIVHGVVMTLAVEELTMLYSDASVSAYTPQAIVAVLEDGAVVPANCYNLPDGPCGAPSRNYALKLSAVAEKMGLPDGYVRDLQRMASS